MIGHDAHWKGLAGRFLVRAPRWSEPKEVAVLLFTAAATFMAAAVFAARPVKPAINRLAAVEPADRPLGPSCGCRQKAAFN